MRASIPTARIIYDRRHVSSASKAGTVDIEVLYKRKRVWISTGVRILPSEWNQRTAKVKSRNDMLALNCHISDMMDKIERAMMECQMNNQEWEWYMLDEALGKKSRQDPANIDLIGWMNSRIEERGDVRESTKKQHRVLARALEEFGGIKLIKDVTVENLTAFDDWLHRRGYKQTTVHGYHRRFKSYLYDAVHLGILHENPYIRMKIKRGHSDTVKYLTMEEVNMVKNADIPMDTIDRVRDMFMFQVYTGLAYADLAMFDWSKVESRNGRWWIQDNRVKSCEVYSLLIMEPAMEILKKYGMRLPVITNQQYNLRLKMVADYAGLNKRLTSHMGRHSFAVMALNMGINLETLASMMGHANIKTTQIYAKILATTVEKAMMNMERKLAGM